MRVSRNEMKTALSRAYEGAGYDIGDYEDAAEQITWAEMSGLNTFSRLVLPPLGPKGNATPRLVFESDGIAVIDAGGADVCQYGSMAGYLAYSKSVREDLTTVQLVNCSSPLLILRSLSLIAQRGVYLTAHWRDTSGGHGAHFNSGDVFPNYWRVATDDDVPYVGSSTITLLCTSKPALLANTVIADEERQGRLVTQISQSRLSANYDVALQSGIEVDAGKWDSLNTAAWPILVPASEQSRTGAGPD